MLADASEVFGADRQAAVARELTKKFEEVRRGTLAELIESVADAPPKGEIVVLIERTQIKDASPEDIEAALAAALQTLSVRDAAAEVADAFGGNKRKIYQLALKLKNDEG